MTNVRSSGIILHPTSLPGRDGIGDLGYFAYQWLDFLYGSGCNIWQVLPLGPTGYGDSPYQCFSAFAGNPYLVSPVGLLDDGLLQRKDFFDRPEFSNQHVEYGDVIQWKLTILQRAYNHFTAKRTTTFGDEFHEFVEKEKSWLDDFSLFMAIKNKMGGKSWNAWPESLRSRRPEALNDFKEKNQADIEQVAFNQFAFFRQWSKLRTYAASLKIQILGDIPIFVAYDSSDAWSHPELFFLDSSGNPTVVAGVPPDYFSPTGQLWGNPLYRWDYQKDTGYAWWCERVKAAFRLYDMIRMDHFRGFAGYWEVPAGMPTAVKGRWMPGPGIELFEVLQAQLGNLKILAEDLGEITPDVIELRKRLAFPGMKILQFAFSEGPKNAFLPHNFESNFVAYTGTHDNDTTLGWFNSATPKEQSYALKYCAATSNTIVSAMIRAVWSSVADYALAPMQDFLDLDTTARMNFPGKAAGNWSWRIPSGSLSDELKSRILDLNRTFGRGNVDQYTDTIQSPPKNKTKM